MALSHPKPLLCKGHSFGQPSVRFRPVRRGPVCAMSGVAVKKSGSVANFDAASVISGGTHAVADQPGPVSSASAIVAASSSGSTTEEMMQCHYECGPPVPKSSLTPFRNRQWPLYAYNPCNNARMYLEAADSRSPQAILFHSSLIVVDVGQFSCVSSCFRWHLRCIPGGGSGSSRAGQ